jgi:plastocyanin
VQTPNHHNARRRPLAAVLLLPLLFAACGGGDDGEAPTAAADTASTATTVEIRLLAFKPETFTVDAGAEVTWKQNDIGAHTVTSGTIEQGSTGVTQQPDGRFDSGDLPKGETFEFTFTEAGTYPYFCRLHPATMRGEIIVR